MHAYSDNRIGSLAYLFADDVVIQTVLIAENDVFLSWWGHLFFWLGFHFLLLFGGPELLALVYSGLVVVTALGRKRAHVGLGFV